MRIMAGRVRAVCIVRGRARKSILFHIVLLAPTWACQACQQIKGRVFQQKNIWAVARVVDMSPFCMISAGIAMYPLPILPQVVRAYVYM